MTSQVVAPLALRRWLATLAVAGAVAALTGARVACAGATASEAPTAYRLG